ncbi:hypothetical protein STENM223S_03267 [Streptomyces tendae]
MTGEDGTADRNGHGMSDERREGAAPGAEQPYDDRILSDLPEPSYDRGRLEAVLGAAILAEKTDGEAERRALEAFRVARDAGAHRARTRRRDDWRPRARRRGARSWKATLSVLLASLTLGGVAYAAIGAGGGDGGSAKGAADDGGARPSVTTSARSGRRATPGPPSPPPPTVRPPRRTPWPTAARTRSRQRQGARLHGVPEARRGGRRRGRRQRLLHHADRPGDGHGETREDAGADGGDGGEAGEGEAGGGGGGAGHGGAEHGQEPVPQALTHVSPSRSSAPAPGRERVIAGIRGARRPPAATARSTRS